MKKDVEHVVFYSFLVLGYVTDVRQFSPSLPLSLTIHHVSIGKTIIVEQEQKKEGREQRKKYNENRKVVINFEFPSQKILYKFVCHNESSGLKQN